MKCIFLPCEFLLVSGLLRGSVWKINFFLFKFVIYWFHMGFFVLADLCIYQDSTKSDENGNLWQTMILNLVMYKSIKLHLKRFKLIVQITVHVRNNNIYLPNRKSIFIHFRLLYKLIWSWGASSLLYLCRQKGVKPPNKGLHCTRDIITLVYTSLIVHSSKSCVFIQKMNKRDNN